MVRLHTMRRVPAGDSVTMTIARADALFQDLRTAGPQSATRFCRATHVFAATDGVLSVDAVPIDPGIGAPYVELDSPDEAQVFASGMGTVSKSVYAGEVVEVRVATTIKPGDPIQSSFVLHTAVTQPSALLATSAVAAQAGPLRRITVSPSSMSLVGGQLATLDVRVDADSGVSRRVIWTSSNSSVATVDSLGRLIAVGNGLTRITATSAANSVVWASASVSVVPPLERRTTASDRAPAPANEQTYFEFQVTKQVTPLPANPPPRYPGALREAGLEGEVLMQFVVDTMGLADMTTLKVLRSSHPLFTYAVWDVLPHFRLVPAELNGRKVRQLVQMPFQFSMTRGNP
jgi:hypothetical protein